MQALFTAAIYFGTFLVIGYLAKRALKGWMEKSGADLFDVQAQAGANRGKRRVILLGFWRHEE
jgi:hypothetical protein